MIGWCYDEYEIIFFDVVVCGVICVVFVVVVVENDLDNVSGQDWVCYFCIFLLLRFFCFVDWNKG